MTSLRLLYETFEVLEDRHCKLVRIKLNGAVTPEVICENHSPHCSIVYHGYHMFQFHYCGRKYTEPVEIKRNEED